MKTPWSSLLQYGTAFATFAMIVAGGLILLAVVGVAVVMAKISVYIK